jgi:predicted TIM-barrel fold metal-dependent hydrolase
MMARAGMPSQPSRQPKSSRPMTPHVREAVEVFGVDRVMFGTDYGPVPIDPREQPENHFLVVRCNRQPVDDVDVAMQHAFLTCPVRPDRLVPGSEPLSPSPH